MISNSYCSFKKGKLCLTSLAALCDKRTGGEKRRLYCLTLTVLLSFSPLTLSPSGLAK